jgi:glucose/arabinose dehydrogenase
MTLLGSRFTLALLGAALLSASTALAQLARPKGRANELYAQLCANCHGDKLQGNKAQSLLDDEWLVGGDEESLARSIRFGFPEREMPAWGAAIPEVEVRAMVIYILEQRELYKRGQITFAEPAESMTVKTKLHEYQLNTWIGGIKEPYSLAFLPGGKAVMTEKLGRVFMIDDGKLAAAPLTGVPAVDTVSQAGLFDVVAHPDYARNGWLYFAYAEPRTNARGEKVSLTRILRGRVKGGALVDQEPIYEAKLEHYTKAGGVHFGGRIAFDRQGFLYFTLGERGGKMVAQDLKLPVGKVHRLHDDGRVPADNPFVKDATALPSIWSYGHRNPQGLALHPGTGELYSVEHGPRGGDELNLIGRGRNYGWPVITYGMEYNGSAITDLTHKEGMEQPVVYWVPSLAVCGMNFYSGTAFPRWQNNILLASLAAQEVRRLELKDGKVVTQEILFKNLGRVRHVITGPDGAIYVLLPERIARLAPTTGPMAASLKQP